MNRSALKYALWTYVCLGIALPLCIPSPGFAIQYTVIDLGTLGGAESAGFGVNASGQVTGQAQSDGPEETKNRSFFYDGTMHDIDSPDQSGAGIAINSTGWITGDTRPIGGPYRAYLYDGTMHDLGTLGGPNSGGRGINNQGQVTGYSQNENFYDRAFFYDGTMHDIGTLGGRNSFGYAINASGQIIGRSNTSSGGTHAFFYDGTMHDIGTINAARSEGFAINDFGMVAGTVYGSSWQAFVYDSVSGISSLNSLIDPLSGLKLNEAKGINNQGQIVGRATHNGQDAAFLYDPLHGAIDLNTAIEPQQPWILKFARSINDQGQITGFGLRTDLGFVARAFLLTPVPEPGSLALAATGGLLLAGLRMSAQLRRSGFSLTRAAIRLATCRGNPNPGQDECPSLYCQSND